MRRLAIGYIWDSPFVYTDFVESVLNLRRPQGYEVRCVRGTGFCPSRRHIDACEKALAWNADLLLILGADQTYPEEMVERLVGHWEQRGGVIAALVPFRGYVDWQGMRPFQPLAWRLECEGVRAFRSYEQDPDMMVCINPGDGAVQRAHITGSGVLLFHTDLLRALRKPWFYDRVDPETMHRVADTDTRFVWRLQEEAGAQLWIDTTIRVKHLHIFGIDETFQERFADWADPTVASDRRICRFRAELPEGMTHGKEAVADAEVGRKGHV